MKNIKHTLLVISIATSLSACSFLHDVVTPENSLTTNKGSNTSAQDESNYFQQNENNAQALVINNAKEADESSELEPLSVDANFTTKYRHLLKENQRRKNQIAIIEQQKLHIKQNQIQHENQDINFYVRKLMQDLVNNLQYVNSETPVAVTDFVMLDSDLNTTNLLGHQIAESLTHEIHKFGIPVIDYKATGYIRVTPEGDFFLTRNYEEVSGGLPIEFIFTGVLTKHQKGYLINAKVVNVKTKALTGTAQSFIPEHVAQALIPSKEKVVEKEKVTVSLTKG